MSSSNASISSSLWKLSIGYGRITVADVYRTWYFSPLIRTLSSGSVFRCSWSNTNPLSWWSTVISASNTLAPNWKINRGYGSLRIRYLFVLKIIHSILLNGSEQVDLWSRSPHLFLTELHYPTGLPSMRVATLRNDSPAQGDRLKPFYDSIIDRLP